MSNEQNTTKVATIPCRISGCGDVADKYMCQMHQVAYGVILDAWRRNDLSSGLWREVGRLLMMMTTEGVHDDRNVGTSYVVSDAGRE